MIAALESTGRIEWLHRRHHHQENHSTATQSSAAILWSTHATILTDRSLVLSHVLQLKVAMVGVGMVAVSPQYHRKALAASAPRRASTLGRSRRIRQEHARRASPARRSMLLASLQPVIFRRLESFPRFIVTFNATHPRANVLMAQSAPSSRMGSGFARTAVLATSHGSTSPSSEGDRQIDDCVTEGTALVRERPVPESRLQWLYQMQQPSSQKDGIVKSCQIRLPRR